MASINTLRPRQNGRHFADDLFKLIFLNKNVVISLKISLKCVPKIRIKQYSSIVSDNGSAPTRLATELYIVVISINLENILGYDGY